MIQIDFYAGSYGNFLEYILNRYIFDIPSSKKFSPFNKLGSSHNLLNKEYRDERKVSSGHYSFLPDSLELLHKENKVIQIIVDHESLYHVYYNSITRAGDQTIDLSNLEINTISKLDKAGGKFDNLRNQITHDYTRLENYPRSAIRNYFYAALNESIYSLDKMNKFIDYDNTIIYKILASKFQTKLTFFKEFQKIAIATGCYRPIAYDTSLIKMYDKFIDQNKGIQSMIKCSNILEHIISNSNYEFETNILEEALINTKLSELFHIYADIECFNDKYPTNTQDIYTQIINYIKNW